MKLLNFKNHILFTEQLPHQEAVIDTVQEGNSQEDILREDQQIEQAVADAAASFIAGPLYQYQLHVPITERAVN